MSFSINNAKVEELRTSNHGEYHPQTYMVEATATNLASSYYPNYPAGGISYGSTVLVTPEAREHLMALRRRIEGSGIPLVSSDELDAEIREMRS